LKTGSIFLRIEADYEELPNMQTVFKKIQENAESKLASLVEPLEYMGIVR
jgi:hypothetical protein